MFNLKVIRLIFLSVLLLNSTCKSKNTDPEPASSSIDDSAFSQVAYQTYFSSLQSSTNLFGTFNQIQAPTNSRTARVIWSKDTSFKISEDIPNFGKFTADEAWSWQVHYSTKLDSLSAKVISKGNFDGDSIDFTDVLKANYTVTELNNPSYFTLTGTATIDRISQILKPRKTYELDSDINLEFRNYKIDRANRTVISGKLIMKLKGIIDKSIAYSRTAEITFDDSNLLIVLDNGRKYPYPRLRIKNR